MTTLVVETGDLAGAAHILADQVGTPLTQGCGNALADAVRCGEMAGSDSYGQSWARAYAPAATRAARAAQDVTNGALALSRLLAASAQNYADAEAASTIDSRHAVEGIVGNLPRVPSAVFPATFDDVGGVTADPPFGWSLVEHAANLVWPGGHQDRLLQAASAWHHGADALTTHGRSVDLAIIEPLIDGIPEFPDIRAACWSLTARIEQVASAHRSLAWACEEYAHHLDVVHSKSLSELHNLLAQSAGIEIVGNVLAVATEGALEAPTQWVEGARIAATAARIGEYLTAFGTAVGEVVAALPTVAEVSARVSAGLEDLLSIRIVTAEVAGVPGLRVLSVARDGRAAGGAGGAGGEENAIAHLANDADLPAELRMARDSPRAGEWNDPALLQSHFEDHAADFGVVSESEYESQARQFFERGLRNRLPTKIDDSGNIRIYDPKSNTFGSYTKEGTTRTFFKPTSKVKYWIKQDGVLVK